MEEKVAEVVTTPWDEIIKNYILNEAKFNDPKKVESHAKKLGDSWLNDIEKRGIENIYINYVVSICNSLTPATHISKLTHSSNGGSSIIGEKYQTANHKYVSSTSVKTTIDGTYDSAALSNYTKFLLLENQGKVLFDEILKDNSKILDNFSIDSEESQQWYSLLRERYLSKPKSDALTKQLYFPIGNGEYHLLQVLKSSSLLQAVHFSYFDKEERKPYDIAKNQRKKGKYDATNTVDFPNLAKIKTVQSQPQNVSVLNGSRGGGRIPLFSCQPPTWKSSLQPPKGLSMFYGEFNFYQQVNTIIDIISAYLVGYSTANLSQKHPDKYKKLSSLVNQLVDILCDYAVRIKALEPNWSEGSKLKLIHQYWLDPYRECEEFQLGRKASDYKTIIVSDFANWLNQRINKKESVLNLGEEQYRLWVKMAEENFRTFNELID